MTLLHRTLAGLLSVALFAACSSSALTVAPPSVVSSPRPGGVASQQAGTVPSAPEPIGGAPSGGESPGITGQPTSPDASPPVAAAPSVAPIAGGLDSASAGKLQRVLDRARARARVPGLSAAVLLNDGRSWAGTSGDRQLNPPAPVTVATVFAIASITKTFVTATVMELVAEGSLSLTDRLDRWVPTVRNASRITLAELLGHTSGIYNYFENPSYNRMVFENPKKRWSFNEVMALVRSPYCAPGTCYHYSNTNFVLLGRIVELVTGRSMAAEVRARFATPLSLGRTDFQPRDATPADRAHAYTGTTDWTRASKVLPTMSSATVAGAAGAMVSSATDLTAWARALYTGAAVPRPMLEEMLSFRKCHDNYGLGTRKVIIDGRIAYGHLGSLRGYMDAMWYFPAEGVTIVLLSNLGGWNLDATVRKLEDVLMTGIGAAAPALDPGLNTRIHDGVTLRCP